MTIDQVKTVLKNLNQGSSYISIFTSGIADTGEINAYYEKNFEFNEKKIKNQS